MGDHVERFNPNGRYRQIPLSCWAIIDFCHNSLRPDPKTLEPNVWCVLYENDYSKMTIVCKDEKDMVVELRGDFFS